MANTDTAPAFTHTEDCILASTGRAFFDLANNGEAGQADFASAVCEHAGFLRTVQGIAYRCQCAALRLSAIETDLTSKRRAQRAIAAQSQPSSATYNLLTEQITELVTRRAAIRNLIGA